MHNDEYKLATPKEIEDHVLTLMLGRNTAGLKKLVLSIGGRKDYQAIDGLIINTLLMNDFVEMYCSSFEASYLSKWCSSNVNHVIQHCPVTLGFWLTSAVNRPGKVVGKIARALSNMPTGECLRLLCGQFEQPFGGYDNMFGQRVLCEQLTKNVRNWYELSPYWVSTPELRIAASDLGWTPQYLPNMVHHNIWDAGAEKWLPSVNYPYTLMACEIFRSSKAFGAVAQVHKETITCFPKASAIDIALAKRILSAASHDSGLTLRRPSAIKALDAETEQRVDGFVQAHVAMDTLDTLAQELAHGAEISLYMETPVELPNGWDTQAEPTKIDASS